jgi:hypothetical protein
LEGNDGMGFFPVQPADHLILHSRQIDPERLAGRMGLAEVRQTGASCIKLAHSFVL